MHRTERDGSGSVQLLVPEIAWPARVVGVLARSGESALIGFMQHSLLIHIASHDAEVGRIDLGERIPHAEQLELIPVSEGFLVRLENGLVSVDEIGRERWRVDRVTFDWRFVDERDDALWLVDEGGNLLGFSLDAGLERT